jgi:hypothetical protein
VIAKQAAAVAVEKIVAPDIQQFYTWKAGEKEKLAVKNQHSAKTGSKPKPVVK